MFTYLTDAPVIFLAPSTQQIILPMSRCSAGASPCAQHSNVNALASGANSVRMEEQKSSVEASPIRQEHITQGSNTPMNTPMNSDHGSWASQCTTPSNNNEEQKRRAAATEARRRRRLVLTRRQNSTSPRRSTVS